MKKLEVTGTVYFISDVHLLFNGDEAEEKKRDMLYKFLSEIKSDAGAVVFAGDLFDFWYEWKHVVPGYFFKLFFKLAELIELGIRVIFITGNHDFGWGDFLSGEVGIECFDSSLELDINSKRFYITHGDGISRKDRGYRLMKKLSRNRLSKFLFSTFVHPDLGIFMARKISHSSRRIVKIDKQKWSEEYFSFAITKFEEGFDYVIMGHLHTPQKREIGKKVYVNCGDWISQYSYVKYDDMGLHLRFFK